MKRCGPSWTNWKPRVRYRLDYSEAARRGLRDLTAYYRAWAKREIEALATDPRPAYAKELTLEDRPNRFRIWLNRWRLIYRVDDEALVIRIVGIRLKTGPETYDGIE